MCQGRKLVLVATADCLQLWERHAAALALLRLVAHAQPREGQFQAACKAAQADARVLVAES